MCGRSAECSVKEAKVEAFAIVADANPLDVLVHGLRSARVDIHRFAIWRAKEDA